MLGVRGFRHPTAHNKAKKQSAIPNRKRIRALENAQSVEGKSLQASNGDRERQAQSMQPPTLPTAGGLHQGG